MFSCWNWFLHIYWFQEESWPIPFVLQTNQKVTVHVNNEQSRNCSNSRGMSVFAVEVPARTKMVLTFFLVLYDNLRNVLVIIVRVDAHLGKLIVSTLLHSNVQLHCSFWVKYIIIIINIFMILHMMVYWNEMITIYVGIDTNTNMCVLCSRCANMCCPSMTNRTGPTTVWRPY